MNITLVSFGNNNYTKSLNILKKEAIRSRLFHNLELYDEERLKTTEFWKNHGDFCLNNTRGFGFWCWKPWVIFDTLSNLEDNDILVYADAGCGINFNCPKENFQEIINELNKNKLGIYCYENRDFREIELTKKDTLYRMDADTPKILNSWQIGATIIYIRKCKESLDFFEKWAQTSVINNYELINDTKKLTPYEEFKDHRHDQSIFSILIKKSPLQPVIVQDNTWVPPGYMWPHNTLIWSLRRRFS